MGVTGNCSAALLQLFETVQMQQFKQFLLLYMLYLTTFWGLALLQCDSWAQLRISEYGDAEGAWTTIPWLSWGMGAWPLLLPPFWAPTSQTTTQRWARSGWGTTPVQHQEDMGVTTGQHWEGGEKQKIQPKEWKYLFRIAFKVWLYFKKQYSNGTRRLYILPVLIPTCVVANKEIKRLFC